jgi:hypothetical protein
MSLIETQAVQAVLLVIAIAAIFAGTTFAGMAGFLALEPHMHAAWAAVIVAGLLIAPVLLGALFVQNRVARAAQPAPRVAAVAQSPDDAAMGLIANLAKEKPLLAILFAGLLGAAGTLVQQKGRVN